MFVIDILIIVVMVLSVCVQLHLARCSQHFKLGLQYYSRTLQWFVSPCASQNELFSDA